MRITLLATAAAATLLLADPAMGFPPKHGRGFGGGGWKAGNAPGGGPPPWAPAWGWRAKQQQIWTPPQPDDGSWRRGRQDSDQWNDGYRRDGAWSRNGYQSPYGQPTYPWGQNGYSWSGQHYQPYGPTQYYSPGTAYPGWHNVYRPAPSPYYYGR